LFSILSCSLVSFLGGPTQLARQGGFGVDHEFYGEVCLGESYRGQLGIPIFGWRQTMPNHSAEEQLRLLP
jgi:hypothetical protein